MVPRACYRLRLVTKSKKTYLSTYLNIQLGRKVPKRFAFYEVIRGYFDLVKMPLKVMLCPLVTGSYEIPILKIFQCQLVAKLQAIKFRNQKKFEDILGLSQQYRKLH